MRGTKTAATLLAITSFLLAAGNAQAQTPTPEATPCCPAECVGLVEATPGGPAAPTNLTAEWGPLPDAPEASGVLLAWQDNAEDETCEVVQRKGPGDVEWQGKMWASANTNSGDDRGVFEVTGEYCYRVFAANERGASVSNEACVYVPEVTPHGPPPAPPPTYPPGVSPATEVPVASATLPPSVSPPPAAPPASGGGSGPAAGRNVSAPLAGLLVAAAFLAAGAATWRVVAARRRR